MTGNKAGLLESFWDMNLQRKEVEWNWLTFALIDDILWKNCKQLSRNAQNCGILTANKSGWKTETGHKSHRLPLWWLSSDHGLLQWWSMWKKTKGKPTQHWHAVQRQAQHHFCHEHQCLQIHGVDTTPTWPFNVDGHGFSERQKWAEVERWLNKIKIKTLVVCGVTEFNTKIETPH